MVSASEVDQNTDWRGLVLVCCFSCIVAKNLSSNLPFVESLSSHLWAPDDHRSELCTILTQERTETLNVTKRGLFYMAV